ncbi:Uncharacterised protein [Serratia plymuthica]|nr:Uncharacterised protein [Serratia plymuthica]
MTKTDSRQFSPLDEKCSPTIEYYLDNPVIPVCAGINLVKDLNHRFVASNLLFSRFSGVDPYRLPTLDDSDMPWAERGDIYRDHEKAILAGEVYNVLEPLPGVVHAFLHTSKQVIYDKNGFPAGTTATAIIMNGHVDFHNVTGVSKVLKISSYKGMKLSANEAKLLFFLLKGLKRKQISELLNINLANYDYCMRSLKLKFNVTSSVQLIDECIKLGYQDTFPFQIFFK